ncbi:hypothetical protein EBT16_10700, partial [bacterium]|nr:hypothetical protein [bacterium]
MMKMFQQKHFILRLASAVLVFQVSGQASGPAPSIGINAIEQREKRLLEREQALQEQLARHEKTIQELKSSLEKEKAESGQKMRLHEESWKKKLSELEKELKNKTEALESAKELQKTGFLGIYDKMEPKQAAKVLESADLNMATQIITQMKAQKAAEVLAKMNPERAKQITEAGLLGQKKKISQKVKEVTENSP